MSLKIEVSNKSTGLIKNNIVLFNKAAEYFRLLIKYDINDEVLDKSVGLEYVTSRPTYVVSTYDDTTTLVGAGMTLFVSGFVYDTKLLYLNIMTQFGRFNKPQNIKVLKQLHTAHMYRYGLIHSDAWNTVEKVVFDIAVVDNYKDVMYDILNGISDIDYSIYYDIITYIDKHRPIQPESTLEYKHKSFFINKDFLAFLQQPLDIGLLFKRSIAQTSMKRDNANITYINNTQLVSLINYLPNNVINDINNGDELDALIKDGRYMIINETMICPHYLIRYYKHIGKFDDNTARSYLAQLIDHVDRAGQYCRVCKNIIYKYIRMSDEVDDVDDTIQKPSHTIRHICTYLIDFKELKANIIINYIRSKVENEVEYLVEKLNQHPLKLRIYKSLYTIAIVVNLIKKKVVDIELKDVFKANTLTQLVDLVYNVNRDEIYSLNLARDHIENELKKVIILASKHTYQSNIDIQDEYDKVDNYINYYLFDYIYSLFKYYTTDARHYNADKFEILQRIFDVRGDKNLLEAVNGHLLESKHVIKLLTSIKSQYILNNLHLVLSNELSLIESSRKNKDLVALLASIKPTYATAGLLRRTYIYLTTTTSIHYFTAKQLPLYMSYCYKDGKLQEHEFDIAIYKDPKGEYVELDYRKMKVDDLAQCIFINSKCSRCGYVREFINNVIKNTYNVDDETIIAAIKANVTVENNTEKLLVYCPLGSIHKLVDGVCTKCGYERGKKYNKGDKYYKYIQDPLLFEVTPTVLLSTSTPEPYIVSVTGKHGTIDMAKLAILASSVSSIDISYFYDRLKMSDINIIFPLMGTLHEHKYEDALKRDVKVNYDMQLARVIEYISFIKIMLSYMYHRDTKPYVVDVSREDIEFNYGLLSNEALYERTDSAQLINTLVDLVINLHNDNLKKYVCEKILYNEFINSKALERYQIIGL